MDATAQLAAKDDKIFELNEQIKKLRNQVTYLQEELASTEDKLTDTCASYESHIEDLQRQLVFALHGE